MLRFATMISGDDYQLLKADTPVSRKKVLTLVSVLFLPVTMWFINVYLLLTGVMKNDWLTALISATVASEIIFMLERSIIMSNGSRVVMVFRILIGLLIAILGSIAFDEVIFKQDIDRQMAETREILMKEAAENAEKQFEGKLAAQNQLVGEKYTLWIASLDKASKEADGTGGSGVRGVNDITRIKIAIAAQNEKDYRAAKAEQELLLGELAAHQEQEISAVEFCFNSHALLARIQAMFDLVCNNTWMLVIYLVVTLILFFLEFVVVILKLCLPKSNYEVKLEIIEEIGKQRMMRVMSNDMNHYDYGREYPAAKRTQEELKKLTSASVFN